MVQLACSCLNIRLHVQESPESLVAGIPNLSPSERQHPFFLKGACPVTLGLGGITEGQRLLVRRSRVGGWTVLECLNCHLLTHATRGLGGDVAASTLLINDANKIQMLQKCDGYSPVFNLVLPTTLDCQPTPPLSPAEVPGERSQETEAALSEIQQQMTKFLKKAQSQVEANIQSFTKQQQAALQALTIHARRDRQTVMHLISNMQANLHYQLEDDDMLGFDMDGAKGTHQQHLRQCDVFSSVVEPGEGYDHYSEDATCIPDELDGEIPPLVSLQGRGPSQPMSMNHPQGISTGMHNLRLSSSVTVPRNKQQQQGGSRVAHSLDVEGLFDMEGMVESNTMLGQALFHSDDEDDTDDSTIGDGGHIPGGGDSMRDLAKSVPVSVPMWPAALPKPMPDDHVVERPSDIHEMAASIKALARSVHTTSVDLFGELPRPRQPL